MTDIVFRRSTYAPEDVDIGIVHIGLGAFHRAHQAWYVESWLNRRGGGPWGICAANIRSNRELIRQLNEQGLRYRLVEYADSRHVQVTEISAIRRALFAGADKTELLAQMASPAVRIVSLTVTEKGYHLSPAEGRLLTDDPGIAHDIAEPRSPATAPGVVLEALKRRRAAGTAPFTVLCCDNMPDNGNRASSAVASLAEHQSSELAAWIRDGVAFPATMVDRIVPAVDDRARAKLADAIGFDDPAAVACEAFSQWVVEDRFPGGRPDWEADGVEMVRDVRPYETMKLRLLNGSHSLLAYCGLARGRSTVAEAMADPALAGLVGDYLDEARASLGPVDTDLDAYSQALLARFVNDALEHRLRQIAMDGSQKLPQRLLAGALDNVEAGRPIRATAEAVAAWMLYVRGSDNDGRRYMVDDPMAETLADCHRQHRAPDDVVVALLAVRDVFPPALADAPVFREAVVDAYRHLAGNA